MRLVRAAWAATMIRLQDAPSARWDDETTIASTPQISQVPRCGRVLPRSGVADVGNGVGDADTPASTPEHGDEVAHRSSTLTWRAAEVGDGDRGRVVGVERPAGEDVDEAAGPHLVGVDRDRARLDELHRRPALELVVAEAVEPSGPCARIPIASITAGTKRRMLSGSASRPRSQPCRSIAASMPQGVRGAPGSG